MARTQYVEPHLGFLVAGARHPLRLLHHRLDRLQIGQHQLRVDRFNIADRIDGPFDVNHIRVAEAADDVQNCVHVADIGEKLVAEPFALRRAPD